MNGLVFLAGAVVVAATMGSAVRTVILPRAVPARLARRVFRAMRVLFLLRAGRKAPYERRDRVMAFYAPVTLLVLLGTWLVLVLAGYTAMFWGLGLRPLRQAFDVSGSSLLTLGFARGADLPSTLLGFSEAALGLALLAMLITYLPSSYSAFSRRELMVALLEVHASRPPSAVDMLVRFQSIGFLPRLPERPGLATALEPHRGAGVAAGEGPAAVTFVARALIVVVSLVAVGCGRGGPGDPLDGTAAIDEGALASLAIERAALGASWLSKVVRADGAYYYKYRPGRNEYEQTEYNEVRHAGTTYSLFQVYGARTDDAFRDAAEQAVAWIERHALEAPRGRALVFEDEAKLGGVALAIVALLERRRVLRDTAKDGLIRSLAEFMLSQERTAEPGRYFQTYNARKAKPNEGADSRFYPGEALLALTRLAQQFPDGGYLDPAVRAAEYLVRKRDGDLPVTKRIKEQDHWLAIALSELYRLRKDEGYRTVAYLQADAMRANQYTKEEGLPARIGAARRTATINYTSTATKGEALVSTWALARHAGDEAAVDRFREAAVRNIQFQMRVQYTEDNTQLFANPDRAYGAWPQDAANSYVRIDFVQHNISALTGAWYLLRDEDVPLATPL